jgi:hypothetical protein
VGAAATLGAVKLVGDAAAAERGGRTESGSVPSLCCV